MISYDINDYNIDFNVEEQFVLSDSGIAFIELSYMFRVIVSNCCGLVWVQK